MSSYSIMWALLLVSRIDCQLITSERITNCSQEIFYVSEAAVFSISEDLRHPGFVIIAADIKVFTTDGVTEHLIAGNVNRGYQEGVGGSAFFNMIHDIVQPSLESVILSDYNNRCLRQINRQDNQTFSYAGNCRVLGDRDGPAATSQFCGPAGLLLEGQTLFICDFCNNALRRMDMITSVVSSVVGFQSIIYMTALYEAGFFLVSKAWYGMAVFDMVTNNETDITVYGSNYTDGPMRTAQITAPRQIAWLNKYIAIIADYENHALRMLNFKTEYVSTMCAGLSAAPWALSIVNGSLLYGGADGLIGRITLIDVPKVIENSSDLIAGQVTTFTCTSTGSAPFNLRFKLSDNTADLGYQTAARDDGIFERSLHWIINITEDMHGKVLKCEVYDHPSGKTLFTTKSLFVYFGPRAPPEDAHISINVASQYYGHTLLCSGMTSNPPAEFSWFRGQTITDTALPISTQQMLNLAPSDLQIEPGQARTVQFLCIAHNAVTERFAQRVFTVNITNVCSGLDIPMWITSNGTCLDCNCSSLSSGPYCDIKTGQCPCINHSGNPRKAGLKCFWYIDSVDPTFGPVAGGTKITVKGGYMFDVDVSSTLRTASFIIPSRNETFLELESPMTTVENVSVTVHLAAKMSGNSAFIGPKVTFQFLYLPNPEVVDMHPRNTIISGGLPITVKGKDLNSVAKPEFLIHLRNKTSIVYTFVSSCASTTSEMMICLTPDMKTSYSTELAASKPNTRLERSVASNEKSPLDEIVKNVLYTFTVGFGFDGFNKLKDLQTAYEAHLREIANITVLLDPNVIVFEDESNVKTYTPGDIIEIRGERLTEAAEDASIYFVTIGSDGVCDITALLDNQIKCKPPNMRPSIDRNHFKNFRGRDIVHVVVTLGNLNWQVGYLLYQQSLWEDPQFRGGIIALVVLVPATIFLVLLVFIIRRRLFFHSQNVPTTKMTKGRINIANPTYQGDN